MYPLSFPLPSDILRLSGKVFLTNECGHKVDVSLGMFAAASRNPEILAEIEESQTLIFPSVSVKVLELVKEFFHRGFVTTKSETESHQVLDCLSLVGVKESNIAEWRVTLDQDDNNGHQEPIPDQTISVAALVAKERDEYERKTSQEVYRPGKKLKPPVSVDEVEDALEKLPEGTSFVEGRVKCGLCSALIKVPQDRSILGKLDYFKTCHLNRKHGGEKRAKVTQIPSLLECRLCGIILRTGFDAKTHFSSSHPGLVPFQCPKCHQTFPELDLAQEHLSSVHEIAPREQACPFCDGFSDGKFTEHCKRFHADQDGQIHQCPRCPKRFTSRTKVKLHLATHVTDTVKVQCPICSAQSSSKDNLKRHIARKHPSVAKKFIPDSLECQICERTFATKSHFKDHMFKHERKVGHVCSFCGKGFHSKQTLAQHVRLKRCQS